MEATRIIPDPRSGKLRTLNKDDDDDDEDDDGDDDDDDSRKHKLKKSPCKILFDHCASLKIIYKNIL